MNPNRWLAVILMLLSLQILATLRLTVSTSDLAREIGKTLSHIEPPGSVRGEDIAIDTTRPYIGNPESPVHLVLFSDFECSACARLAPLLGQLRERFSDSLCISFRNFPLSSHFRSRQLAELGELAWRRGVFWEFHDSLFARQDDMDDARLLAFCKSLDIEAQPRISERLAVDSDLALAEKMDVKATPTLFVNGRRIVGTFPLAVLERIVSEELRSPKERPMMCDE